MHDTANGNGGSDSSVCRAIEIRTPLPKMQRLRYMLPTVVAFTVVTVVPPYIAALTKSAWVMAFSVGWMFLAISVFGTLVAVLPYMSMRRGTQDAIARLRATLDRNPRADLQSVVDECGFSELNPRFQNGGLRRLAQTLCAFGRKGRVIRYIVGESDGMGTITPLAVPFEPVELRATDAALQGLAQSSASRSGETWKNGTDEPNEQEGRMRLIRRRRIGVILAKVLAPLLVATSLALLIARFAFGQPIPWWEILAPIVLGIAPIDLMTRCTFGRRRAWVFPQGIALRKRWLKHDWLIVRRSDGVMVARPLGLLVVTETDWQAVPATADEASLALRAWYATVPPPSKEQLASFFG